MSQRDHRGRGVTKEENPAGFFGKKEKEHDSWRGGGAIFIKREEGS